MNLTDTLFPMPQKQANFWRSAGKKFLDTATKAKTWFKKAPTPAASWPVTTPPAAASPAATAAASKSPWYTRAVKKSIVPSVLTGTSYGFGYNSGAKDAEALAQGAAATAAAQTAAEFRSWPGRLMNLIATDDMVMERMRRDPMGEAVANTYKLLRSRGNQGKLTESEMLKLMRSNIDPSEMSWLGSYGLDRKIKKLERQQPQL